MKGGKKARGFILQGNLQWPCSLPMPWPGKKGLPRLHLCIFHCGELLLCPSLTQLKVWTTGGGKGMSLVHVHQRQAEIFIHFRHPFQQKIPHLPTSKKKKEIHRNIVLMWKTQTKRLIALPPLPSSTLTNPWVALLSCALTTACYGCFKASERGREKERERQCMKWLPAAPNGLFSSVWMYLRCLCEAW